MGTPAIQEREKLDEMLKKKNNQMYNDEETSRADLLLFKSAS